MHLISLISLIHLGFWGWRKREFWESFILSLPGLIISGKASRIKGEIKNSQSAIELIEKFGAIRAFSPIELGFGYTFSMGFQWQIGEITLDSVGLSGGDLKWRAWQKMGGKRPHHILCFPTSPMPSIKMERVLSIAACSQHTTSFSIYIPQEMYFPLSAAWDAHFNHILLGF